MEEKDQAMEPIVAQLKGISAPIGTILGPNWEMRYMVVVGYSYDGLAQLGYATAEHMRAAQHRCREEGVFHSLSELSTFRTNWVKGEDEDPEKLRHDHMQRLHTAHTRTPIRR